MIIFDKDTKNLEVPTGYGNFLSLYDLGYEEGKTAGYADGYADGAKAGEPEAYKAGYSNGFASGKTVGYASGYTEGYNDGRADAYGSGYTKGYTDGYSAGETGETSRNAFIQVNVRPSSLNVSVTVTCEDITETKANVSGITMFNVYAGANYTIKFAGMTGYATPASQSGVALYETTTVHTGYYVDESGDNVITYMTTDNNAITLSNEAMQGYWSEDGAKVVSNTFDDGVGHIVFSSAITSVLNSAFKGQKTLSAIYLPDSVTTIWYNAFLGCLNLSYIKLPANLTQLMQSVFESCRSLNNVVLPSNVEKIWGNCFFDCERLTSIIIPDSTTTLYTDVFYDCTNLKDVVIGSGMESIYNSVFMGCTSLTGITISSGVETIGISVFENCSSLSSITIPDSVKYLAKSIGGAEHDGIFYGCDSLTSVTIGSGVLEVGNIAGPVLNTIEIHATTAPSIVGLPSVIHGVLRYPKGSDYSTWIAALPSTWTYEEIEI